MSKFLKSLEQNSALPTLILAYGAPTVLLLLNVMLIIQTWQNVFILLEQFSKNTGTGNLTDFTIESVSYSMGVLLFMASAVGIFRAKSLAEMQMIIAAKGKPDAISESMKKWSGGFLAVIYGLLMLLVALMLIANPNDINNFVIAVVTSLVTAANYFCDYYIGMFVTKYILADSIIKTAAPASNSAASRKAEPKEEPEGEEIA